LLSPPGQRAPDSARRPPWDASGGLAVLLRQRSLPMFDQQMLISLAELGLALGGFNSVALVFGAATACPETGLMCLI
jgi:hypothetical protein